MKIVRQRELVCGVHERSPGYSQGTATCAAMVSSNAPPERRSGPSLQLEEVLAGCARGEDAAEREPSEAGMHADPSVRMLVVAIEVGHSQDATRPLDYLSWPMFFVVMAGILGLGAGLLYIFGGTR